MNSWIYIYIFVLTGIAARSTKELKNDAENEEKIAKQLKEIEKELEVVEKLENELEGNSSRDARGLLKKLSFLAGMKMGGMIESQGTLAASNSLRIFGKVMNTALSVSYGPVDQLSEVPGVQEGIVLQDPENQQDQQVEQNIKTGPILVESSPPSTKLMRQGFLKNHNNFVERVNHKFLRDRN